MENIIEMASIQNLPDDFREIVKLCIDNKVIVGGSLALLFQGYSLNRPIKDIDIIVNSSDQMERKRIAKVIKDARFVKENDTNKLGIRLENESPGTWSQIGYGDITIDIFTNTHYGKFNKLYIRGARGSMTKKILYVLAPEEILRAKYKYLSESNLYNVVREKHTNDIIAILNQYKQRNKSFNYPEHLIYDTVIPGRKWTVNDKPATFL